MLLEHKAFITGDTEGLMNNLYFHDFLQTTVFPVISSNLQLNSIVMLNRSSPSQVLNRSDSDHKKLHRKC